MQTADFDYFLPPDHVAVAPSPARDDSRLLVMDRRGSGRKHLRFRDILPELPPRALIVVNDTRVFPARLRGRKSTGGAVEYLLTRRVSNDAAAAGPVFRALGGAGARPGLGRQRGRRCQRRRRRHGRADRTARAGRVLLRIAGPGASLLARLDEIGEVPLPPYIEAARRRLGRRAGGRRQQRYQTVYAASPGAVAAPTAGLHFTPELLAAATRGRSRDRRRHAARRARAPSARSRRRTRTTTGWTPSATGFPAAAAAAIARRARRRAAGGRGRHHGGAHAEAAARASGGDVAAGEGETDLFILPGDRVPRGRPTCSPTSTCRARRCSCWWRRSRAASAVLAAYREAVARGYRFYSYGDAMLIRAAEAAPRERRRSHVPRRRRAPAVPAPAC